MNKIFIVFILTLLGINYFWLNSLKQEIIKKRDDIKVLKKEIFEYSYMKEIPLVREITGMNKVVELYTIPDAAKDTISFFKVPGVFIISVNVKKSNDNEIDIKLTANMSMKKFMEISKRVALSQKLIIFKNVAMKKNGDGNLEWTINIKRIFEL